MAQSSGSCMNSPSGHSYYKFCCRSPALHVITSHSEAPSLSGETYLSATEEESDFFSGVRLAAYQPDKYSPTRVQKMKSKHVTYTRNDRQFQNFCDGDDYLPKTFKNLSLCNGNVNGCLPDCPVHSKICKKPVDINKLEESYWAQWKPGKCDSKISVCKINEKIKPVGGCKVPTTGFPTTKMPTVNLANYVQCKTCHKYIEKDRIQPDCIRCLHRNLDIIDSDSSELDSHPLRRNRTIQEDDENESLEDEVPNGTLTGFVMTPEYTSELTENDNSIESVSHRKLHRLGARPSHRVNRTSSRHNEQVPCIAKCSKCRSSETTTSTVPSKRYESKCNSINNFPVNRCIPTQENCLYQKVSKAVFDIKRSEIHTEASEKLNFNDVSPKNSDNDIVYPTKDKEIDVIKSAQKMISKSSKFCVSTPKSDDCDTTDHAPDAQFQNCTTSSHNSMEREPSENDLQKTCSSCCHCRASFARYCPEVPYCERVRCCKFEPTSEFFAATTDNTGTGRRGASLINEIPEKEEQAEVKRVSTPRTETKPSTEPEKEAAGVQPLRESETPRRGLRRVFHLNSEKAAAEPQPVQEADAAQRGLRRIFHLDSEKDAAEPQPVRESEAPRRLRRIFHLDSIQSEPRKSESVDTTDTRPSMRLSNQAKLGTSKRIFIRPHSYPLRTGRAAARGNGRNTSRGRRR